MNCKNLLKLAQIVMFGVVLSFISSCKKDDEPTTEVVLKNQSVTPALVKKLAGFENLEVFSLLSSDDVLEQSPNYIFGGSADGAGYIKNPNGEGFIGLINHEDNFAVSRITFDKTFKPIKGEYILNSTGGIWRLCSATLVTPAVHGFGPTFLTCGESGEASRTHALNPFEVNPSASTSKEKAGLGRWSAENAVPLPSTAYANKTVIIIGDDDFGTVEGGQVAMYVSNTVGDLDNGSLYVLKRTNNNQREMDMVSGQNYDVEFVKVDNHTTLTGRQMNETANTLKAIKFGRVEDIDYRKGSASAARELYFNVTGEPYSGTNADQSRTKYGRVYKLVLSANDPLKGTLSVLLDGDVRPGIADKFQNPDNIYVGQNYIYIQEDPNGYGDETHDAYIYQYNIATGTLSKVLELDHRRDTPADIEKYNRVGSSAETFAASNKGSWEYGAMEDISDLVGIPNTFVICVQPHTWRSALSANPSRYRNPDGGTLRPNENQASQLIIVKGLPK